MLTQQCLVHLSVTTVLARRLFISITIAAIMIAGSAGSTLAGNSTTAIIEFGVGEISAMDVNGTLSRPVTLTSPEPGASSPENIGDTYLRYTSVVSEGKTRMISAAITAGSIPHGCKLKLNVTGVTGNGQVGNAVPGGIYLSGNPQNVISGIGNCYTGTSGHDGVQLKYTLEVEDASKLITDEKTTVTVLFTIN